LDTERYDILAKAEKQSTVDELHRMMQSLLADRFQLKVHHETKEGPIYALTVDKAVLKLTEHDEQDRKYEPIRTQGPERWWPITWLCSPCAWCCPTSWTATWWTRPVARSITISSWSGRRKTCSKVATWRTYSYVPHPDSSGCPAVPGGWRPDESGRGVRHNG
jgi:hypothetical protein